MNLPNKLTLLRVILIPFFLFFLLTDFVPFSAAISLGIFAIASLTDALDGHIARKHNLITTFGKFLDPLADKMLVVSALIAFVELELVSSIPVIIIVAREFMVSGLRLVTAGEGVVVPAGIWGKLKTAFTMATLIIILLFLSINVKGELYIICDILVWVSTALTIISGAIYLKAYSKYIDSSK